MYKTELYHHGVKGQKWGVRRYQNKDGSLTDKGKRIRESKWNQPSVKQGKGKGNITPAQSATRDIGTMAEGGKRATNAAKRMKKQQYDYSGMTDAEIRARVNRLNLERQLYNLEQGDTRTGYDRVMDILEIAGGVATVAGGAASIIALINGMKK